MTLPSSTLAWTYHGPDPQDQSASHLIQDKLSAPDKIQQLLSLQQKPLPKLGIGMALVRVEGSPVNPSDTLFIRGKYGIKPKLGDVPGFEGCGTVIAANAGPYGWWLKGRRVSFGGQDGNGAWAQYVVVSAFSCIPVSRHLPIDAAASLIVNPMTAIGLMAKVRRYRSPAVVVNAANSALGRYLIALSKLYGVAFIGLVRRDEVCDELLKLGAAEVLNTSRSDAMERFKQLCDRYKPRVLLDAVAGRDSARLMHVMPDRSICIVYGKLEDATLEMDTSIFPATTDADGLVFRHQRVEGYWLTHELHGIHGIFTPLIRARKISQLYRSGLFKVGNVTHCDLSELAAKIDSGNGGSKLILRPHVSSN